MRFTIRQANINDLLDLVQIETHAFDINKYHLISQQQYRYLLTKANTEIWLATVDGKPRASSIILYRKNAYYARLYSIAVVPDIQGHGIGTALLDHAEKMIREKGLLELRQEVRQDNHVLINRYTKMGYLIYGQALNYYPDGMACVKLKKAVGHE